MSSRYSVALGVPGETHTNTLVLSGATVIVPIEMDPDCDPLHDDEVRMWSARGSYDRTLTVNDPDVVPDLPNRLMHYHFCDVPFGVYRVAVCVAGQWHDLMHDVVVTRDGVYLGGKKFSNDKPAAGAAPADPFERDDAPDDESDEPAPTLRAPDPQMEWLDGE